MTNIIFEKMSFNVTFGFDPIPSANMEEEGFVTYAAASHQGAINMNL